MSVREEKRASLQQAIGNIVSFLHVENFVENVDFAAHEQHFDAFIDRPFFSFGVRDRLELSGSSLFLRSAKHLRLFVRGKVDDSSSDAMHVEKRALHVVRKS